MRRVVDSNMAGGVTSGGRRAMSVPRPRPARPGRRAEHYGANALILTLRQERAVSQGSSRQCWKCSPRGADRSYPCPSRGPVVFSRSPGDTRGHGVAIPGRLADSGRVRDIWRSTPDVFVAELLLVEACIE